MLQIKGKNKGKKKQEKEDEIQQIIKVKKNIYIILVLEVSNYKFLNKHTIGVVSTLINSRIIFK